MNMSRACPGMLSSENDDYEFLKKLLKHKMHVHHVHHSSRTRVTLLFIQTSLPLTRNMNVTVAEELYYFFPKYRNFDTSNFSLTLRVSYCCKQCVFYFRIQVNI